MEENNTILKLGDILKAINFKLDENLINQDNLQEYPSFVVNRIYSNFPDTLFVANTLNQFPYIDKDVHYKYLYLAIPKRKRFSPLKKVEKDVEFVEEISSKYGISKKSVLKHYNSLKKGA